MSGCRVTCMVSRAHEVFVGTGSGDVLVLDGHSHQCTARLSLHGGPVRSILSLPMPSSGVLSNGLATKPMIGDHNRSDANQSGSASASQMRSTALTGHTAINVCLRTQTMTAESSVETLKPVSWAFFAMVIMQIWLCCK